MALVHAQTLDNTLQQLDALHPDLIMIGPNFLEHESFAICREIISRWPGARIVLFSAQADDPLFQADAAHAGAAACLCPEVTHEECLAVIAGVMAGQRFFPYQALRQGFQVVKLTAREQEVLKLLAEGKTDREIASELVVKATTVRNHSQHILEKLSVHNRKEAVRRARRRGWV